MEKSIELQNNTMEYGQSGAYQAYITYMGLDETVKKKIAALTMERLDEEDSAEVRKTVEGLKTRMPMRIDGYMSFYDGDIMRAEIERFYTEFMKAFQDFRVMNDYM